jgi:integrase
MQRYASSWKRLWEVIPSDAKLDDIDQAIVSEFKRHRIKQAALLERSLSYATINRDLAALGAFLTWCSEEKDIRVERPRLKYYQESKGRTRWLSKDELTAFRQACPDQWWPLFGLLLSTGITISEALGLRRTDIDLKNGRLSIHEEYGRKLKRSSRNRELHIPEAMRSILREWLDNCVDQTPSDLIFPFSYWPVRKVWHSICDTAGIHAATVHDARHTFAVHAVQSGVPEARLQKLLGHAHPGTTRRYAMHSPEAFLERDAGAVSSSMGLADPI